MRVKFLKKLLWVVNTLLVLFIVAYALLNFIMGGVTKTGARSAESVLGKRNIPEAARDLKSTGPDPVGTFSFVHELPINGMPPVKEVVETGPVENERVPPLKQNYDLIWVKVDLSNPVESIAHLQPKSSKDSKDALNVTVGEKVENVWKLIRVQGDPEKAEFLRVGTDERVVLDPKRGSVNPLAVGEDGGAVESGMYIGGGPSTPPPGAPTREAIETSTNVWQVPQEEVDWWGEYGEDQAQQIAVEPVRDPKTKKPIGLLVKKLEKKSLLRQRGIQEGDILKSINGVPVTTRKQAMAYMKGPGKDQPRYTVIIERKGREYKKVYNTKANRR